MQGKQQWWGVEFSNHKQLEDLSEKKGCCRYKRSETYPLYEDLLNDGIPVHGGIQCAGDCVIIPPTVYHWGHADVGVNVYFSDHLLFSNNITCSIYMLILCCFYGDTPYDYKLILVLF